MDCMEFYQGTRTPETVFARQRQKGAVLAEMLAALGPRAGERVLEIGAGPGYLSLLAAAAVGPAGEVFALDLSAAALAYLSAQCAERGITWVRTLVRDAADPGELPRCARFLVVDVLHDAEDPQAIVAALGRLLPPGAVGVVGDYLPLPARRVGPPLAVRIAPQRLVGWLEQAGFRIIARPAVGDEHYALKVEL